jgi:hypothetical protein
VLLKTRSSSRFSWTKVGEQSNRTKVNRGVLGQFSGIGSSPYTESMNINPVLFWGIGQLDDSAIAVSLFLRFRLW